MADNGWRVIYRLGIVAMIVLMIALDIKVDSFWLLIPLLFFSPVKRIKQTQTHENTREEFEKDYPDSSKKA